MSTLTSNKITDLTGKTILNSTGGILQVASTFLPLDFTTSSNSYVPVTGLSVTMTPTNSSSKFFIISTCYHVNSYGTQILVYNAIYVNGVVLTGLAHSQNDGQGSMSITNQQLYSPNSTAQQTFQTYVYQISGNNTTVKSASSRITVFEIA